MTGEPGLGYRHAMRVKGWAVGVIAAAITALALAEHPASHATQRAIKRVLSRPGQHVRLLSVEVSSHGPWAAVEAIDVQQGWTCFIARIAGGS